MGPRQPAVFSDYGAVVGGHRRVKDPLKATLAAARGCEHVSSISFRRAGGRPGVPFVEALARFDQLAEEPDSLEFTMDEGRIGNARRIRLCGELDIASAPSVRARLEGLAGRAVGVDCPRSGSLTPVGWRRMLQRSPGSPGRGTTSTFSERTGQSGKCSTS